MGEIPGIVYYLDVNSMYPYVMRSEKYPICMITYKKHSSVKEVLSFIKQGFLITARVEIKTNEPVFFKKEERLTFPIGTFKTCISTPEFIYGAEHSLISDVLEVTVYEGAEIFVSYIDHFYNCRLEARAAGNEVLSYLFKIFMNSLYGKFGQKENYWERIDTCEDVTETKETSILDNDTGCRKTLKIFGGGVFENQSKPDGENDAYNAFPAVAAHVTAHARMLLWKFILIAGRDNVYYMDTDSLFVNKQGYDNLESYIDPDKLGYLKLEKESNGVTIKGCKDYTFGKEVKLKGVPKNAVKISENEYAVTVWRGMAKGIKSGNLKDYANEVIIKKLKREYTKGNVAAGGKVTPIDYK